MAQPKYHTLIELVSMIDGQNQTAIFRFINAYHTRLQEACGSSHNHQAWKGGWWDHTTEAMNTATVLYPVLWGLRPLPFTLSDALLVLFMHDVEKPWKGTDFPGSSILKTKDGRQKFRTEIAKAWNIHLTDEQMNGIQYAEGELDDYTQRHRVMGPLASFVHVCDVLSARLWPNNPLEKDDPWHGAFRTAMGYTDPVDGVNDKKFLEQFQKNAQAMIADMLESGNTY